MMTDIEIAQSVKGQPITEIAKAAGIGALVCVVCDVLLYLIALIGGITFAALG